MKNAAAETAPSPPSTLSPPRRRSPGASAGSPERLPARDRLLAAADELFYEGGIHTVGIDRVIERAGVAKATLYDIFGSKDALIRAYLEARHDARKARLSAWLERYDHPRERLLGVFDAMVDLMKAEGFRGCAFTRAGSESAPTSGRAQRLRHGARLDARAVRAAGARCRSFERPRRRARRAARPCCMTAPR